MPTHVALLRGINVGGRNKVAMADLRAVVSGLGHADIATYVASGNVVFTPAAGEPRTLAVDLQGAVAGRLDVTPAVIVLTRDELAHVVAANPFPDVADPRHLHAVLHQDPLTAGERERVTAAAHTAATEGARDEAAVVGRTVFLHTPDGMGRSRLAVHLDRVGGMATGTARNWRTVTRLLALLDG